MEQDDFERLSGILSDQALYSGGKNFFKNLISQAKIPKEWKKEVFDIWTGRLDDDADELIRWAIDIKGDTNPEDYRFKTLGSLLYPLLPNLGIDKARLVIELIIRYDLFQDKIILIDFLVEHNKYQAIFNRDSINILVEYIGNLIEVNKDVNKISENAIKELIEILIEVEEFELVSKLFLASCKKPSKVIEDSSNEIAILKENNIDPLFKIFVLFYLLLERYPEESEHIQRIVNFSYSLEKSIPKISDTLRKWLIDIKKNYGYQPSNLSEANSLEPHTESDKKEILEVSLMIFIRKSPWREDKGKWLVNGYLIINNFLEKKFDVDSEQEELLKKDLSKLELVEEIVLGWVDDSEDLVRSKQQQINCDYCSITIEFFLPFLTHGYLSEEADKLTINSRKTIGQEYKVIVRCYERIALDLNEKVKWGSLYFRHLKEKWKALQELLKNNPHRKDFRQEFECNPNYHDLERNLKKYKIGLKLACPLPTSKTDKAEVFKIILETGIPIAIWLRENQQQEMDLEQETDKWLKREYLENLNLLLDEIRVERENAYFQNSFLGQHLVIFCDNPERRPPRTLPLKTSNPLSVPQ